MADLHEEHERRIRERAYRIWLDEGQPEGRAENHWQLAEFAIAKEDGLSWSPVRPAPQSETPPGVGHAQGPKPSYQNDGENVVPRKEPFAQSGPPLRRRLTATARMNGDAAGWLRFAVHVVFVTALAGAVVYGIAKWRRGVSQSRPRHHYFRRNKLGPPIDMVRSNVSIGPKAYDIGKSHSACRLRIVGNGSKPDNPVISGPLPLLG